MYAFIKRNDTMKLYRFAFTVAVLKDKLIKRYVSVRLVMLFYVGHL